MGGGAIGVQPFARGLHAKESAAAFANSENAKWPVAEVSRSHAFTRGDPFGVCGWEFGTYRTECMANE